MASLDSLCVKTGDSTNRRRKSLFPFLEGRYFDYLPLAARGHELRAQLELKS